MLSASCLKDVPLQPTQIPVTSLHGNGNQVATNCTLHRTGSSSLEVWEYPPGEFEWRTRSNQSTCVLAGCAEVDLADGRQLVLGPGVAVYLPEGMHGHWVIKDTLRMVTVSIDR